jgi:nucleoside-diphosphate kinase
VVITTFLGAVNSGNISCIGFIKNERKGAEIMTNRQFYFSNDQVLIPLRTKLENMSNRTFTMIKPDAMKNGHAGAIIDRIIREGFKIIALKQTTLSAEKAGEFYAIHKERPFYGELVSFMSSGPIIAAILEKSNAVSAFRTLIGATDPAKAGANTIRKLYAASVGENAVHGSDSDENAKIEGDFFFSGLERI